MFQRNALGKLVSLVLPLVLLDQAVKWLVQHFLPHMSWRHPFYPYGGVGVLKDLAGIQFSIVYTTNKGAAWGVFAEHQSLLMVARIAIALFLTAYLLFFNRNRALQAPLSLIVAGAVGNILDYFIYGHVVDMWCFYLFGTPCPIFNTADALISTGVVWLLFASYMQSRAPSGEKGSPPTP